MIDFLNCHCHEFDVTVTDPTTEPTTGTAKDITGTTVSHTAAGSCQFVCCNVIHQLWCCQTLSAGNFPKKSTYTFIIRDNLVSLFQ